MLPEKKYFSQHGEDGVIEFLHQQLRSKNYKFIEIGCASGDECNSRYLLENGWFGICVDADATKVERYRKKGLNGAVYIAEPVTSKSIKTLSDDFYQDPDVFSLDIDSYDFFIMDWLLKAGFAPKIICVEVNTFLPEYMTVDYKEHFSRYAIQPQYGLYFGCSHLAYKDLLERHGYTYCGLESSNTNAFFSRDCDFIVNAEDGFQTYFCEKYQMNGEELRKTLEGYPMLDVRSPEYAKRFNEVFA